MAAPGFQIVKRAVASAVPAFLVMAVRVRAEQHTSRFQRRAQFPQHARQLLAGNMKQRGIGKHAIEMLIRQIEPEEILLPHLAAAVGTRHVGQARGAFQTYGDVTEFGEHLEVTPRPAAEIEYRERRLTLDGLQQRRDVLADVVVARAFPGIFGTLVIIFQREVGDFLQVLRIQFHVRGSHLPTTTARGSTVSRCHSPRGDAPTHGARLPACGGDAVVEGRERLTSHAYAVDTGAADSAMVPRYGPVINTLEAELLEFANAQLLPQAMATMLGLHHQAIMGVSGIGDASV